MSALEPRLVVPPVEINAGGAGDVWGDIVAGDALGGEAAEIRDLWSFACIRLTLFMLSVNLKLASCMLIVILPTLSF